jgi:rSAM/selenodomain-associated transferase 2
VTAGIESGSFEDLSVIIPTLNAASALGSCLDALAEASGQEIVVVDGGLDDLTADLARGRGATLICAPRGRGMQLRAGADRARGPWLLFLHADTRLEAGWSRDVRRWILAAAPQTDFAVFTFKLDSDDWRARLLERLVSWRVRWLGLPYGDQGLVIHRDALDRVGGYAPLPLMEDVDLAGRLRHEGLTQLATHAVTSAERWRRDGWLRRSLRNLACLGLFKLGVSPSRIAQIYGR